MGAMNPKLCETGLLSKRIKILNHSYLNPEPKSCGQAQKSSLPVNWEIHCQIELECYKVRAEKSSFHLMNPLHRMLVLRSLTTKCQIKKELWVFHFQHNHASIPFLYNIFMFFPIFILLSPGSSSRSKPCFYQKEKRALGFLFLCFLWQLYTEFNGFYFIYLFIIFKGRPKMMKLKSAHVHSLMWELIKPNEIYTTKQVFFFLSLLFLIFKGNCTLKSLTGCDRFL